MIRLLEGADMYTPEEIEKMIDKLQKDLFTASAKWEAYKKRGDLLNMTIEQRRQKFQQEFAILEKEHNINVLSSLIIRTA